MKTIVVKLGSSVIAPAGELDSSLLTELVKDILEAESLGYCVVLVSSGAIACGLRRLGLKKRPLDTHQLMAIASLGQILLMDHYTESFDKHKKLCAQILLTWDDFDNRKRFLNARQTIQRLLTMGVVPIINENDAVSHEEIRFGDNDRLSALVADLIGAKLVLILSDVEGLLDGGRLVRSVSKIDSKISGLVKKEDKVFTSGGMSTKLEAAKIATSSGIKMIIASGRVKGVIAKAIKEEDVGTAFLPSSDIESARKRWIAFSKKTKGKIYVDDGAKEAILKRGKSLLCVGITKIEGDFKKKDAVCVVDKEGSILGCGLVNYSCDELKDCRGKKFDKEIIHRDDFVKSTD
jgi:glutamate 5-kinase